jgi:uncharacterized sodium:solute symporter family permease YidK
MVRGKAGCLLACVLKFLLFFFLILPGMIARDESIQRQIKALKLENF